MLRNNCILYYERNDDIMFEKTTNTFVEIHTIEVTCEKTTDKAFCIYDFIQFMLDDPDILIFTCGRKANFNITLGKFNKQNEFIMKWDVVGHKRHFDNLFKNLSVYENKLADKANSTETVYVKFDDEIVSKC